MSEDIKREEDYIPEHDEVSPDEVDRYTNIRIYIY